MFFSDSLFLSIVNAEPDMMFSWNPPVNLFCRRKQEIDQRFFYLNLGAQKILEGMSSVIYFTASQTNKTLFLDFFLFFFSVDVFLVMLTLAWQMFSPSLWPVF